MKKLVIALLLIAFVISGYRFLAKRKGEEPSVGIIEEKTTLTPTPTTKVSKKTKEKGEGLPSSGVSTEEKPTLSPEELEKLIKEFEAGK